MATLPRPQLFCWDSVDQLGDLQRLRLVLDALPDEPLMQALEAERGIAAATTIRCVPCGTP